LPSWVTPTLEAIAEQSWPPSKDRDSRTYTNPISRKTAHYNAEKNEKYETN